MKITGVIALFLVCGLSSCRKETAPQPDGNKSEVKSFTVTANNWNWEASESYSWANVQCDGITSDIYSSGAVLVYRKMLNGEYQALPYTIHYSLYSIEKRYIYWPSYVKTIIQYSDLSNNTQAITPMELKIVCISSSARKANPNIDYSDYKKVMNAFLN